MKINKDIIRNNNYELNALDFVAYLKLVSIRNELGTNVIKMNFQSFKQFVMIYDNRTLKKVFSSLYNNKLISKKYDKFPTKGSLNIELTPIPNKDMIDIPTTIFDEFIEIGHKGVHLVSYLLTYHDDSNYDYSEIIQSTVIQERLIMKRDSFIHYYGKIKANKKYSFLTDKVIFKGNETYQEKVIMPRKTFNYKNLELKLEKYLSANLFLIEERMEFIARQVEIADGRIDILARDKNNILCIIELKVVSNDEKLVFQSVYYPTQFNEPVRMITIAPDYDYKIKTALDTLGVERKSYQYNDDILIISNAN